MFFLSWREKIAEKEIFDQCTIQISEIPKDIIKKIKSIQENIDPKLLNISEDADGWVENGMQKLYHITLLYGISEDDIEKSKEIIKKYPDIDVETDGLDYFDNRESDGNLVLIIKLSSPELKKLHEELKENIPNKHNHDYIPHITVAYLNGKLPEVDFENLDILNKSWNVNEYEVIKKDGKLEKLAKNKVRKCAENIDLDEIDQIGFENADDYPYSIKRKRKIRNRNTQEEGTFTQTESEGPMCYRNTDKSPNIQDDFRDNAGFNQNTGLQFTTPNIYMPTTSSKKNAMPYLQSEIDEKKTDMKLEDVPKEKRIQFLKDYIDGKFDIDGIKFNDLDKFSQKWILDFFGNIRKEDVEREDFLSPREAHFWKDDKKPIVYEEKGRIFEKFNYPGGLNEFLKYYPELKNKNTKQTKDILSFREKHAEGKNIKNKKIKRVDKGETMKGYEFSDREERIDINEFYEDQTQMQTR